MNNSYTSFILNNYEDDYDIPKTSFGRTVFQRLRQRNFKDIINCIEDNNMPSEFHILGTLEDDFYLPKESFGNIIFGCLKHRNPNGIVNIDAVTKEILTCGRLLEQSIKLTFVLKTFGIKKGDVIAIVSENTINYIVPIVAAFYMGVAVNPINPEYTEGELKNILLLSKPKLIFCSQSPLRTIIKVKNELDFIETVLLMGPKTVNAYNISSYETLLETTIMDPNGFEPEDFDYTEQVAFIVSSSGTTGLPKGVMLTHQNLRIPIGLLSDSKYGNTTMNDTTVVVVPFFHIYGSLLQILTLITSMKSIVMDKFKSDVFLQSIEQYKVTKLFIVPALVQFLVKSPLVTCYDIRSVKDILVGTATLGKQLQDSASTRLGNTTIRQMYGLTETCGPCTLQTDINKSGSVGVLVRGTVGKVCNPDTKEILGPLVTGEICLKGPLVMKGYIPSQNHLDEDGFFHSGDLGFFDQNGYFYIVDRIKDLIKYKGFQVAPAELEALIITHPFVKDCGVIGIPDERAGEVPLAFIVLKSYGIIEQEIIDFVAERISPHKRLYGGVTFVEQIPRTSSGKIMRRKLVEIFKSTNITA